MTDISNNKESVEENIDPERMGTVPLVERWASDEGVNVIGHIDDPDIEEKMKAAKARFGYAIK